MPLKFPERLVTEAGYPATYRQSEVSEILRAVRNRQSILVCGLGGSGKSHLLRFLAFHPAIPAQVGTPDLRRVYLDCNAISLTEAASLFRALLLETGASETIPSQPADALPALRRALAAGMTADTRFLLILDRFERIPPTLQADILDGLRHVRDYLDRRVSYVLGSRKPAPIARLSEEFEDLLAQPAVVWVGPLAFADAHWNAETILAEPGIRAEEATLVQLIAASGGHARLLRAVVLAWVENPVNAQAELLERLLQNQQVRRVCENLWRELDEQAQTVLESLAQGKRVTVPAKHPLRYYGLIHDETAGQPSGTNPLLMRFIGEREQGSLHDLTALEQQLWDLVRAQPNTLLRREDLITAIYGDNPDAVNDEALTALAARLRRKLTHAGVGTLEATRGLGYRFMPMPDIDVRR